MNNNFQIDIDKLPSDKKSTYIKNKTIKDISNFLGSLGRLPADFDDATLLEFASHKNEEVRSLAIKNLAKLRNISYLNLFSGIGIRDESTNVRREAVSAIGRLRKEEAIPTLKRFLGDKDPKVTMQAIRGLLVFSDKLDVQKALKRIEFHPNELIREIIQKELAPDIKKNNNLPPHSYVYPQLKNVVVHADVLDAMKVIKNESVHLTFTSPPYYNARDYSIYQSYDEYLKFLEKTFKEVHRITKEGRFFILNTSPVIMARVSRQHASKRYPIPYDIHPLLVKMGWEYVDDIVWIKPEASVKNRNAGFLQHRKPLAYKPNAITEMLMVYRKKTSRLIDWNIKQYPKQIVEDSKVKGNYETSNVWRIDPAFDKIHSAVFPIELCRRVIKFYSYISDLIFDPFAGSGTLGKAAKALDRNFLLVEKEKKYIDYIKAEFSKDKSLFTNTNNEIRIMNLKEFAAQKYDTYANSY